MSIRNLDSLFDPASIAVFGASLRVGSVGATVWRNLSTSHSAGRYKGQLFAVNPKRQRTEKGRKWHGKQPGAHLRIACKR